MALGAGPAPTVDATGAGLVGAGATHGWAGVVLLLLTPTLGALEANQDGAVGRLRALAVPVAVLSGAFSAAVADEIGRAIAFF